MPAGAEKSQTSPDVSALRVAARVRDRDLAFACGFLPAAQQGPVLQVLAMYDQLAQVLGLLPIDGQASQAASTCDEACGSSCDTGMTTNAEGCVTCGGGESPEQRRAVCASVLEFVYEGSVTGKPTLDGFHQVVTACRLPRDGFEQWCDGWVSLMALPRIATWSKLRGQCDATMGRMMVTIAHVLHDGRLDDRAAAGARDWGAACGLMMVLSGAISGEKTGAQWLPLDDLVACRISDRELAAWRAEPASADVAKWSALVERLCDRAMVLHDAGVVWLQGLPPTVARGPAVWGQMQRLRWQKWRAEPMAVLTADGQASTGLLDRLRCTRGAMRVLAKV
jgi:phytoene/squalene synthetase